MMPLGFQTLHRARRHAFLVPVLLTTALPACGARALTPPNPAYGITAKQIATAPVMPAPQYTVTDLGTFGGRFSAGRSLNNEGWVTGISRTGNAYTCCDIFLWRDGVLHDLDADQHDGSITNEDHGINDRGQIVGWFGTRIKDPNGENFCSQGQGNDICLPLLWSQGQFSQLPILKGHNAFANAINARGEIVGAGEGARDDSCPPPQVYHFAAAFWANPKSAAALPPAKGDTDAQATAINDAGEAAGASGTCTAGPIHAVVWNDGTASVLPTLGGATFNVAFAVNNAGDAAGQSDLPGDMTHHAVLWHNGLVTDLGTIHGLPVSLANALNDSDQVAGFSQRTDGSHTVAELWQNGSTWDLNSLIPQGSGLYLIEALDVNNRGEITGYAYQPKSKAIHGFLLTPSGSKQSSIRRKATAAYPTLPADIQQTVRVLTLDHFWHRP